MDTNLLDKPIHTAIDLHQYWLELMGPLGFSERLVYFTFLDHERRAVPQLHEIGELPEAADEDFLDGLMTVFTHFSGHFAFALLLARPGCHPMDSADRAWARALIAAGRRHGIPLEPIHLATDDCLVPFAGDDLIG